MILPISSLSFLSTIMFYSFPNMPFVIFDWLCVFAPMTGYIDQLFKMIQSKNSSKFKKGSSLVLLFSNFLRIVYWYGNRFAEYLLWQSVVTIIVHLALCFTYYSFIDLNAIQPEQVVTEYPRSLFNFQLFEVYTFIEFFLTLLFLWVFIISLVLFFCFFVNFRIIAEFIGLISNLIDSFQTFPPFYAIVVNRDISCITNVLVMQYISGTCCKAVLFLCRPVPWPFRVGVAFQAFFVSFITIEYSRMTITLFHQSGKNVNEDSDEISTDDDNNYNDDNDSDDDNVNNETDDKNADDDNGDCNEKIDLSMDDY